jgi:hypothetical protein
MTTTRKKRPPCTTCSGSGLVPGPCVDASGRRVTCARPGACPHDQDGDVPCPDCRGARGPLECAVCRTTTAVAYVIHPCLCGGEPVCLACDDSTEDDPAPGCLSLDAAREARDLVRSDRWERLERGR